MNIVVKIYDWVSDRMAEPSSYAAIGAVVMGLGILFDSSGLVILGIIGGAIGFILKEKGII
jgi:hypothetical protein|tara:strand:+ start:284 stop:466 length:183 start_codon:yes stop_codon:yes gene_type:complete